MTCIVNHSGRWVILHQKFQLTMNITNKGSLASQQQSITSQGVFPAGEEHE